MHAAGTGDGEVVRIAAEQRGLITRRQLEEAGVDRGRIARRVGSGRLFRTT